MKHESLHEILDIVYDQAKAMVKKKNATYSSNNDALANFKTGGSVIGTTPYQTWSIYFWKHVSAIFKAVKDNPEKPEDTSEGFRTKVIDAISYLGLLYALDIEREAHECTEEKTFFETVMENITKENSNKEDDDATEVNKEKIFPDIGSHKWTYPELDKYRYDTSLFVGDLDN